ncbi:MAG: hypothetical protein JWR10_2903 [Rubritepida sp.]|nr:hypothetical protein [Rubritepida sp.]
MDRRAFFSLIALTGCAGEGLTVYDPVRLPPDSIEGAGDPTRSAVTRSAFAFGNQAGLAGRPGEAARAIADMEFLAAALPADPRYQQRDPLLPGRLSQARTEWRQALGIPGEQPAQPLIDSFYMAWRASRAGDMAAAAGSLPPGVWARLGALPPLPQTSQAANAAARVQSDGNLPINRNRL